MGVETWIGYKPGGSDCFSPAGRARLKVPVPLARCRIYAAAAWFFCSTARRF
jgi:hypothetical protein